MILIHWKTSIRQQLSGNIAEMNFFFVFIVTFNFILRVCTLRTVTKFMFFLSFYELQKKNMSTTALKSPMALVSLRIIPSTKFDWASSASLILTYFSQVCLSMSDVITSSSFSSYIDSRIFVFVRIDIGFALMTLWNAASALVIKYFICMSIRSTFSSVIRRYKFCVSSVLLIRVILNPFLIKTDVRVNSASLFLTSSVIYKILSEVLSKL